MAGPFRVHCCGVADHDGLPPVLRETYNGVYIYVMRRTTVFLEDALLKQAHRYADRHGKSFAQVVREALTAYLAEGGTMKGKLPSVAAQFASGRSDVSSKVDDLLWTDPHR